VSITQLVGQCIIICRGRGSNPGHPTYSLYKVNSIHGATSQKQKKSSVEKLTNMLYVFLSAEFLGIFFVFFICR